MEILVYINYLSFRFEEIDKAVNFAKTATESVVDKDKHVEIKIRFIQEGAEDEDTE